MAYGLKYTLTFRDEIPNSGVLYEIKIYESGWMDASSALICSEKPLTLNYKKGSLNTAIYGSELTVGIYATTPGQYDAFLTAEPLQFYIQVYQSTNNGGSYSLYWQGVNTTDNFSQPESYNPYLINLKFNCGLGELQWHRYEDDNIIVGGNEQIIQILFNCLSFLPYAINVAEFVNIREDTMSDANGLLEQLYLMDQAFYEIGDDGIVHGMNCNKVLNLILTALGCRIYQSNNQWFVERVTERTGTAPLTFIYDSPGSGVWTSNNGISHASNSDLTLTLDINNASLPRLLATSEKTVTQKQPILAYNFNVSDYDNFQLVPNPWFEDTPTSKNQNGYPLRWDRGSGNVSIGGDKLILANPYAADARYKWAYDFGSSIITDFNTWCINNKIVPGTSNLVASLPVALNSPYSLHASLRPSETPTDPWVWVNETNDSIQVNIQFYVKVKVTVGTPASQQLVDSAASFLYDRLQMEIPYQLEVSGSDNFYQYGELDSGLFTNAGQTFATLTITPGKLGGAYYPNGGYQTEQLDINQLLAGNENGTFELIFMPVFSFSIPAANFAPQTGNYTFDLTIFPPFYQDKPSAAQLSKMSKTTQECYSFWSFAVTDFGLMAQDMEIKNSFQSASSYLNFYSSGDEDLRWNELKINVVLGDTVTPGYPGSFRISSGSQTGTWHVIGGGTGNILADTIFEPMANLAAQYRNNLRCNIIGDDIEFWNTVVDEDGTLYMQVAHIFDLKAGQYQIEMMAMAIDEALSIGKTYSGSKVTWNQPPQGNAQHEVASNLSNLNQSAKLMQQSIIIGREASITTLQTNVYTA